MPPKQPTESVDITRLNRAERRKMMKSGKMPVMIPGRNLPFVKKFHGEITNFYGMRDKELKEEKAARMKSQVATAVKPISHGNQAPQETDSKTA
jgi:hypothetical protein